MQGIQDSTDYNDELLISFMTNKEKHCREETLATAYNDAYMFDSSPNEIFPILNKLQLNIIEKTNHVTRILFAGYTANAEYHKEF